jgi:hypothetical protein
MTIVVMVYNVFIRTPKAKHVAEQLQRELSLIQVFPNSTLTHSENSYKDAQALIDQRYSTAATYVDLRKYYDVELPKHGWKFSSERTVTNYGRDLGGRMAHYCKGDLSADVQYIGEAADGKGDYALALSWGLYDCP